MKKFNLFVNESKSDKELELEFNLTEALKLLRRCNNINIEPEDIKVKKDLVKFLKYIDK